MNTNPDFLDRPDPAPVLGKTQPNRPAPPWHQTPGALARPPWLMPFRDSILTTGLVLLLISLALFGGYSYLLKGQPNDPDLAVFFVHYALAGGYAIVLMNNGLWKFREQTTVEKRASRWVCLLLFLVSAFALNRELAVFRDSTEWLCVALLGAGASMTAYAWTPWVGIRLQQVVYFLLAVSMTLFVYAALILAPMYPVGMIGLLALGMSVHMYIPLLLAVTLARRIAADYSAQEHLRPAIWAGLVVPLATLLIFLLAWNQNITRIETIRNESVLRRTNDLPDWVLMAQRIDMNNPVTSWIINRLLGVGIQYDEGPKMGSWGGMNGLTNMDDVMEHDPLVVIASRLLPTVTLAHDEKLNLLRALNTDRHNTEEKFWSGRHLTTESVVTQARIWPQFRLSYTEKTLRIRNAAQRQTGEALYTFHLPVGSVVTSMSLWINGKEEKARLTTVAKADSAYRQIVNVESRVVERDPAVVYWQEGSRVTVRVYPCPAGQERQVKLGITSPLRFANGQLIYENPWFDGPTASSAQETLQIDFDQQPVGLSAPFTFEQGPVGQLSYRGNYKADWSLQMKAPALSSEPFVLDDVAYQLTPYQPKTEPFTPEAVYLDLNAAWSLAEFETVWQRVRNKPVFVYDDGLVQLTDANRASYFERLTEQQFSLFPVYRIENPERALLLTQSGSRSLFLTDLTGSSFAEYLNQTAGRKAPLRVLSLSTETAGYLKTLAEFRAIRLATSVDEPFKAGIGLTGFPILPQQSNAVVLSEAGVSCHSAPRPTRAVARFAPDHLARLFGYNHLVSSIGPRYFDQSFRKSDALLTEAQHAHILSPLSSLIVLETEIDYDRFGIKKDANGLQNATLKDEGAVPEPHEWAILTLLGVLLVWLRFRRNIVSG